MVKQENSKCSPVSSDGKRIYKTHNRPVVAQRVPRGLDSQISWHLACEGGEVVSLTHQPPLPSGMFLVLVFAGGWVDPRAMVRSERNMSLKNLGTPPGIDPGTVRLVVQRLNRYAIPGPFFRWYFSCFVHFTGLYVSTETTAVFCWIATEKVNVKVLGFS